MEAKCRDGRVRNDLKLVHINISVCKYISLLATGIFFFQINVGLVDLVDRNPPDLKIRRGSTLPVSVKKSDSALAVTQVAVQKQLAHNQTLRKDADVEWVLVYPDMDVVLYLPGTSEFFYVEGYKESIGRPYNRINVYLCKKTHYDGEYMVVPFFYSH